MSAAHLPVRSDREITPEEAIRDLITALFIAAAVVVTALPFLFGGKTASDWRPCGPPPRLHVTAEKITTEVYFDLYATHHLLPTCAQPLP